MNRRRYFLEELGYELIKSALQERKFLPRTEATAAIVKELQIDPTEDPNMSGNWTNSKNEDVTTFVQENWIENVTKNGISVLNTFAKNIPFMSVTTVNKSPIFVCFPLKLAYFNI